jgi:hypothetical protein
MEFKPWVLFVVLAGLCWGTYVPLIAQGGKELKSSYASFLCVGVAYFLIAILVPIFILWVRGSMPNITVSGVTLASLAGTAGALGALCVIFATIEFKGDRKYVGPVIFATAPVINTLVSLIWHPSEKSTWNFHLPAVSPHWTLYVGIVLAGLGAFLVLFSKELTEEREKEALKAKTAAVAPPTVEKHSALP